MLRNNLRFICFLSALLKSNDRLFCGSIQMKKWYFPPRLTFFLLTIFRMSRAGTTRKSFWISFLVLLSTREWRTIMKKSISFLVFRIWSLVIVTQAVRPPPYLFTSALLGSYVLLPFTWMVRDFFVDKLKRIRSILMI